CRPRPNTPHPPRSSPQTSTNLVEAASRQPTATTASSGRHKAPVATGSERDREGAGTDADEGGRAVVLWARAGDDEGDPDQRLDAAGGEERDRRDVIGRFSYFAAEVAEAETVGGGWARAEGV